MTKSVYFTIRMEVELPKGYNGVIEEDMNIKADFNETEINVKGAKIGDVEFCGFVDADELF